MTAASGFARMQTLAGTWKLSEPKSARSAAFRIQYRVISNASAVMELFGDPAGDVTETIYHPAGERLMATHYCAQGNQPRLLLSADSVGESLHFTFLDVTNLARPGASHLTDLRLTPSGADHLVREETYVEDGVEEHSTLKLERVRP